MTWQNKVLWTEGMFLQPQHFQQQDRANSRLLHARVAATSGFGAGFSSLQVDRAALETGQFAIASASGVLPDGTPFDIPGTDAAPAALKVPADVRDEIVMLAVTRSRPGVAESDVEGASSSMPARYLCADVEVADAEAVSLRQAPIQVGRLNLRLVLARDANEGYTMLGTARLRELAAGGALSLDDAYIPPMLHAPSHPVLDGYQRELLGLLHQRGEMLASLLSQPGRAGVARSSTSCSCSPSTATSRCSPMPASWPCCIPSGCMPCAFSWPANWPPTATRGARRPTPTTSTTIWPAASAR
jgi:type VI secretion system protein ImpJ